jgi:hypothetical protein
VAPGETYATLPFLRPGADILLRVNGWPKANQVLPAIDSVEPTASIPPTPRPITGGTSTIA